MAKISVLMSTYNEKEAHLRGAIESILDQTYSNIEFLIVLDNPANAMAERVVKEYAQKDGRIRVLKNEKNLGLVGALNRALAEAEGEYIARMDSDDFALPERLERELAYLEEQKLDIVGALIRRINEAGEVVSGVSNHYGEERLKKLLNYGSYLPHPTWLARRSLFDALGGYRNMPRCEDYDFLLRARAGGYGIGLCPAHLLNYRISDEGISQSALLDQFLAARYISHHAKRIDQITVLEVEQYLQRKATPQARVRYARASALFYRSLGLSSKICRIGLLLRGAFGSYYFCLRLKDMLLAKLCR